VFPLEALFGFVQAPFRLNTVVEKLLVQRLPVHPLARPRHAFDEHSGLRIDVVLVLSFRLTLGHA